MILVRLLLGLVIGKKVWIVYDDHLSALTIMDFFPLIPYNYNFGIFWPILCLVQNIEALKSKNVIRFYTVKTESVFLFLFTCEFCKYTYIM
jgi:hypothetical protein